MLCACKTKPFRAAACPIALRFTTSLFVLLFLRQLLFLQETAEPCIGFALSKSLWWHWVPDGRGLLTVRLGSDGFPAKAAVHASVRGRDISARL